MKFISHRGNISNKNISSENNPDQIEYCIKNLYDVEIDIRHINGLWFLGHDEPQYQISIQWLTKLAAKLWIHCKNIEALDELSKYDLFNCFWHNTDDYTLTSKNIIWAYPGKTLTSRTVCVLPETVNSFSIENLKLCYGICSDSIDYYRRNLYV